MVTLRVTNNTVNDIFLSDVGFIIPASSFDDFTDHNNIFDLISRSQELRTLVNSGNLSLSDGTNPLTITDLYNYWMRAGFNTINNSPPTETFLKSPDGSTWKITIDDLGIVTTSKVKVVPVII